MSNKPYDGEKIANLLAATQNSKSLLEAIGYDGTNARAQLKKEALNPNIQQLIELSQALGIHFRELLKPDLKDHFPDIAIHFFSDSTAFKRFVSNLENKAHKRHALFLKFPSTHHFAISHNNKFTSIEFYQLRHIVEFALFNRFELEEKISRLDNFLRHIKQHKFQANLIKPGAKVGLSPGGSELEILDHHTTIIDLPFNFGLVVIESEPIAVQLLQALHEALDRDQCYTQHDTEMMLGLLRDCFDEGLGFVGFLRELEQRGSIFFDDICDCLDPSIIHILRNTSGS